MLFLSKILSGIRRGEKHLSAQRVFPLEAAKSGKILIRGVQFAIMLDGERGQMRVINQVAYCIALAQEPAKDFPMTLGGYNDAHTWLIQPALNAVGRFLQRHGPGVHSCAGGNSTEPTEDRPRQAYGFRAAQLRVPPVASGGVKFRKRVVRVEEEVAVDEYHL